MKCYPCGELCHMSWECLEHALTGKRGVHVAEQKEEKEERIEVENSLE